MGTMTETGTEKRVDELSKRVDFGFGQLSGRVDFGFDQVNRRLDESGESIGERFGDANQRILGVEGELRELRSETHRGFERVDADIERLRTDTKAGFDSLQQLMIRVCAGTIGSIIAGVVVLLLSHS
jgi:tetrahydromethanopterin S-methyltransferase subunit G